MPNYVTVLSQCFPDAQWVIRAGKEETLYTNIDWLGTPIDQAVLDASECAIVPKEYAATDVSFEDAFGQVLVENFSKLSNATNAWLSHNGLPSDGNPSIIPFNGKLVGIAFSNEFINVSTDVEIYITPANSEVEELAYTWEFRNGKKGFNNMATQMTFDEGAKVSVYLRNAGKSPKNVDVTVYLQVISASPAIHIENE